MDGFIRLDTSASMDGGFGKALGKMARRDAEILLRGYMIRARLFIRNERLTERSGTVYSDQEGSV